MAYRRYNGEVTMKCDTCLGEETGPDDSEVWQQRFWTTFNWTIDSMSPNTRNYRLDMCAVCSESVRLHIEDTMKGGHFEDFPKVEADGAA